jgi:hypothetical protein
MRKGGEEYMAKKVVKRNKGSRRRDTKKELITNHN